LNASSGNALNFAAAGLTAASLGAVGTQTYSGVLTPAGASYLLGGGGGTLILQSQLTGGSTGLAIGGALGGSVVLANTGNSYGGGTFIGGGVMLDVPSDAVLGPTSSGITFTGNGSLQGYGTNVALSSARAITINSGVSGAFDVLPGATLSIPGAITGAGALVKLDSGTLNLSGAESFTGGVLVSAGTLNLSSSIAVNGGASGNFDILSGAAMFVPGVITGSGSLVKLDAGLLNLSGANTFSGGVVISAGTLQLGSTAALNATTPNIVSFPLGATGHLQLNGNSVTIAGLNVASATAVVENASAVAATLTVNNAANPTFAGILQNGAGGGPLALTTVGTGVLQLTRLCRKSGIFMF
jgi:autotransporter-associated beta strand protein